MKFLKKMRNEYVKYQVKNIRYPEFTSGCILRKKYVFSGRVQHVGFRKEVYLIAQKIGLTGWIQNRTDGKVEAQIQGEKSKIEFLIRYMKSLKRIRITNLEEKDITILNQDNDFTII
ncbi:acylphosphatase [Mobilitalea sibirica]|nr:acylphosphatase [Mobilitalea sibirica]